MAVVAKPTATNGASLGVENVAIGAQLTPNFFNSIFTDGMNPFDDCFGSSAAGGMSTSSLLSALRKEMTADKASNLQKDEALLDVQTKADTGTVTTDQLATPDGSPMAFQMADTTSSTNDTASISRSPSPFTFKNPFLDSPLSSGTPTTSPENFSPVVELAKEEQKAMQPTESAPRRARKSMSLPKITKPPGHKRNLSLPQDWSSTMQVSPQVPDAVNTKVEGGAQMQKFALSRGVDSVKPSIKARTKSDGSQSLPLVSRMDGIFVTESIPSSDLKGESNGSGFSTINGSNLNNCRKRKKSTIEEEDEEDAGLGEADKRARFLERNRVAASKCRKKKKLMNQRLEEKSRVLIQQNRFLSASLSKLRGDVLRLKQLVLMHHDCKHQPIERFLHQEAGKFLGNDNEDLSKRLEQNAYSQLKEQQTHDSKGSDSIIKTEQVRVSTWLDEFHSFEEVESAALKQRDSHMLEFDDEDFQRLLLSDQLNEMDEDFDE